MLTPPAKVLSPSLAARDWVCSSAGWQEEERELGLVRLPVLPVEQPSPLPRRGSSSRYPASLCCSSGWHNR
jgi:hypothetical protein